MVPAPRPSKHTDRPRPILPGPRHPLPPHRRLPGTRDAA